MQGDRHYEAMRPIALALLEAARCDPVYLFIERINVEFINYDLALRFHIRLSDGENHSFRHHVRADEKHRESREFSNLIWAIYNQAAHYSRPTMVVMVEQRLERYCRLPLGLAEVEELVAITEPWLARAERMRDQALGLLRIDVRANAAALRTYPTTPPPFMMEHQEHQRLVYEAMRRITGLDDSLLRHAPPPPPPPRTTKPMKPDAELKGHQLLLDNLTNEQRREYLASGKFRVKGGISGREYAILHGRQMNIYCGARLLCITTREPMVTGDVLLTQKLAFELDEDMALREANFFPVSNVMRSMHMGDANEEMLRYLDRIGAR